MPRSSPDAPDPGSPANSPAGAGPRPGFAAAARVWLRVGLTGFGGPAGQIAILHREVVTERRWVGEDRFLHALNFCTMLPGPEAQQLATYLGWLLHGTWGGIVAGGLFVLPGALLLLILSWVYAVHGALPAVAGIFGALKAAVLVVVLDALRRIGGRALRGPAHWAIAVLAFVGLAVFRVPFPLVILFAGLTGWAGRLSPDGGDRDADEAAPRPLGRTLMGAAGGLMLWWAPTVALAIALGSGHLFVTMGRFFAKAAVVTFGGAYSVLSYVGQQAVERYGWLAPGEMLDGLALAETTPGPLILVLQFVGFLAGYRHGAPLDGTIGGLIGTAMTLWATFVPSFLFVLLAAPYVERLRGIRGPAGAMAAITAAVVGVIASLALWFAVRALFGGMATIEAGPVSIAVPAWGTVIWFRLAVAVGAAVALWRLRWPMLVVLVGAVVAGVVRVAVATP